MRNRFYVAPHCSGLGVDEPGAQAYLRGTRALGGWGAVHTEYCGVSTDSDDSPWVQARLLNAADAANLSLMVTRVHEGGALAGIQLVHMGPDSSGHTSRLAAPGPSQLVSPLSGHACYEMSLDDIRRVQRQYVDAAVRARDIGFDIIQIAAREGFSLPLMFLWKYWNKRTDEYGGTLENRVRFWRETLEQVRDAVGDECAVTAGFCVDALHDGDPDSFRVADEGIAVIELLDDVVDLWDVQVGHLSDDVSSSRFFESFWQRSYIEQIKPHTTKPVAAVGRFTDPDLMADMVREGVVDIIAAARPAIADPYIPNKIREGRIGDIRECIGCNICVSRFNMGGGRIVCTQNATTGEEYRRGWNPEIFTRAANADHPVLVVGAGPSGLECARVLAERGFDAVHVVEARDRLGGAAEWTSRLPGLTKWRRVVEYREHQLSKLGVNVITNRRMTTEDVLNYGASIVIIATGSVWDGSGTSSLTHRSIPGADSSQDWVLTPEQIMLEGKVPTGRRVLVYDEDGYHMGSSIAHKLALDGFEVTLASPAEQIGSYMFYADEGSLMHRALLRLGVILRPSTVVSTVTRAMVRTHHPYDEETTDEVEVDSVVLVTSRRSTDALYRELMSDPIRLKTHGIGSVFRIGDSVEPRLIADAVFDGHRLAREIDTHDPSTPLDFVRENRVLGSTDSQYEEVLQIQDRPSSDITAIAGRSNP
ncbi:MAG: FAD-dependent oxidoreductase [Actinobacteria bacterium]|nr:FAD-dependent oxidoreductase [Actinomycetota bacterium]